MAVLHIGLPFFIIFFFLRIQIIISLIHHGDGDALQALKNSWKNTPATWNQSNDPCSLPWEGVKCNSDSRVIELKLQCPGVEYVSDDQLNRPSVTHSQTTTCLEGKLGGVIGDLTELKSVYLSGNYNLTGPLPPQLGNLSNLYELRLDGCSFTGSIPDELGNLTQLQELDLSRNKLRSKIPPSLGKLSKLDWLDLSGNQLSGKLPFSTRKTPGLDLLLKVGSLDLSDNKYLTGPLSPQLGNLSSLFQLLLGGCSFTGTIPDEFGNFPELIFMNLSGNELSGKIPPSLGKLSKLDSLDLSDNLLSGKLPVSTGKTPGLDLLLNAEFFWFHDNKLSGSIPSKLFSPNMALQVLFLSRNQFDEKIPNSIGLVKHLNTIWLNQNALSGEIPSTISNMIYLSEVNLAQNKLSGALPDLSKNVDLGLLDLSNNSFDAAKAPTWFSTLPLLRILSVENGSLHGPVPTKLFDLPKIKQVNLGNNAFSGTLAISGANNASQLQLVDLQNNHISSITIDSNSTSLIMLKGNPICAKAVPNTSYCNA